MLIGQCKNLYLYTDLLLFIMKKTRKFRVPRTRNAGTFTESQYFSRIRTTLRNGFRYWKPMMIAAELASRPSQSPNKEIKKEYQCATCKRWFKRADVQIDHKEECGSLSSYEDIVPFIKKLTREDPMAYQILCKRDHKLKTNRYLTLKKNGRTKT
jgi:hypothetical protein